MEALLSLYRQTLAEDIEDTLKQANAHTLQRKLYENSHVFGQLCKYDNFHWAFSVPPNPCESVSFLRFWRGVEDAITAPDSMIESSISFELQKALFVDDGHLRSMRHFRDELLKQGSSMPISTFLSIIDSCSNYGETSEFWSRARENSRQLFEENEVYTNVISDMVLGYLTQRLCKVHTSSMDLRTMSTCVSLDEDAELAMSHSNISITSMPTSQRSDNPPDSRYRKLLEELDACLPTLYNNFCDRIDELNAQKQQLESECKARENALEELKSEFAATKSSLEWRCGTLQECNAQLSEKLEDKNVQLKSYRLQVDTLTRRMDSLDPSRLNDEVQAYMKRCIGLEQANIQLRNSVARMERHIVSTIPNTCNRTDACVGPDERDTDAAITASELCDPWSTSQERAHLMQELEACKADNVALNTTIFDMRNTVESLSQDLAGAKRELISANEMLKDVVPLHQHMAEKENLNGRIDSMEGEMASLQELVSKLQSDCRVSESERHAALSANADLERALAMMKTDKSAMESELELLRTQCKKGQAETAMLTELQRRVDEYQSCNADLQARLGAMARDKMDLVAHIETLTSSVGVAMDAAELTDDEDDEVCSSLSSRTATTKCDNMIRINPALAETRRLNTLNAVKYGQINVSHVPMPLSSSLGSDSRAATTNRRAFEIRRSITMDEEPVDIKLMRDPRAQRLDSSETASLSEDDDDVFQNAAAYFSGRFSFGVRADS
ncbi:hypothetical protein X943_000870 [Babesia divergens]|uniref:Uncharacterized protein n=1 Tax=Babesia divergens TaxID=32595 RepID=A0AAD9GF58_BABDI|nr:hypothetical protein X943_000870 [Babesia divergens]